MNFDISDLLSSWEYQAGQIVVRKFIGKDGKEKIQLRVDLGLLQMNALGRPDGKKPFGKETIYDHYISKLRKHEEETGGDEGFRLDPEACGNLQQEAIQFHHRYICLFQLKDFNAVIRDTERNVEVFNFVEKYAEISDLALPLQQLRPQLLMMRVRAQAAMALEANDYSRAAKIVEQGLDEIKDAYARMDKPDLAEQSGELYSLESFLNEINSTRPLTERERLEKALNEAVQKEDFERAAKYRDRLKGLKE